MDTAIEGIYSGVKSASMKKITFYLRETQRRNRRLAPFSPKGALLR
jgi:hypothetical protein